MILEARNLKEVTGRPRVPWDIVREHAGFHHIWGGVPCHAALECWKSENPSNFVTCESQAADTPGFAVPKGAISILGSSTAWQSSKEAFMLALHWPDKEENLLILNATHSHWKSEKSVIGQKATMNEWPQMFESYRNELGILGLSWGRALYLNWLQRAEGLLQKKYLHCYC